MKKVYVGYVKCVMMGVWFFLCQFMYIKWIIVVDEDINVCDWKDVMWVVLICMDLVCDIVMVENIFIDYFDFVLFVLGFGFKIGFDVINKVGNEIQCEWGEKLDMDDVIKV